MKAGDWDESTIIGKGGDNQPTLNGAVTATLSGEMAKDGAIALQLHAGPPMRVKFRNIRIRRFD